MVNITEVTENDVHKWVLNTISTIIRREFPSYLFHENYAIMVKPTLGYIVNFYFPTLNIVIMKKLPPHDINSQVHMSNIIEALMTPNNRPCIINYEIETVSQNTSAFSSWLITRINDHILSRLMGCTTISGAPVSGAIVQGSISTKKLF